MDADRFDSLARSLTVAGPRRRVLATAFAGALGALGLANSDEASAAKSGKCKPKCGECEKCRKGECNKKNGKKRCRRGRCVANPRGTVSCSGTCVNLQTDPRNCGSCGKRCQLNAICSAGICTCVRGACPAGDATCCPASAVRPVDCRCTSATNPGTCESEGAVADCPPGTVACDGPRCGACCPSGSTCDPSTGTCLRN